MPRRLEALSSPPAWKQPAVDQHPGRAESNPRREDRTREPRPRGGNGSPCRALATHQLEVYFGGLQGVMPRYPVDFAGLEGAGPGGHAAFDPEVRAGRMRRRRHTSAATPTTFRHWGLVPRMMVDCSARTSDRPVRHEAAHAAVHGPHQRSQACARQDGHGDLAAARAAAATGVPLTVSTLTNDPLEDIAAAMGDTPGRVPALHAEGSELAASLVSRAEAAGYKAIVVTLDTWVTGWRPRDLNNSSFPQLRGRVLSNYFSDPRFRAMLGKARKRISARR